MTYNLKEIQFNSGTIILMFITEEVAPTCNISDLLWRFKTQPGLWINRTKSFAIFLTPPGATTDIYSHYNTFAGAAAIWGVIAVGLFADNPEPLDTTSGRSGLFKGKSLP
jgi:hypothetical protein